MVFDTATLQHRVEGYLIRGGTSKGFFTSPDMLPSDPDERDKVILELFGSPDPLQVDGLGGTHTHTSKLMLISEADRSDADVAYEYAQVGISNPTVDWTGNCGNLVSAVGLYAILEGYVTPVEPATTVRIYSENTDSIIEQEVPVAEGEPNPYGSYRIDGVPGTGARVQSRYLEPGGGILGATLPTGNSVDELVADGESYDVSIVDATNVTVFLRATDLGLTGTESPAELEAADGLLEQLERIRGQACVKLGLVDDSANAVDHRPTMPFIAVVSAPQSYQTDTGTTVTTSDLDVTARMVSTQRPHHAYATTGAMCLAAATRIPETVPHEVASRSDDDVRIGHPKGTITIGVDTVQNADSIRYVSIGRTARLLMSGTAFYRDLERVD
jgi:2-methylaconitate cis-trans-isomerase PrpF